VKTHKLAIALLFAPALLAQQKASAPDTIFLNGNILTGTNILTPFPNRVSAIAVAKGTILAVGTDAQIKALKTPSTKVIDLNNAFAMPGFNDAHTHIASAGQQKLTVDLDHVPSLADMQARIKSFTATLPAGGWLLGGGWDHTLWASKTLPTRQDLDAVTAGHPAIFSRTDGHIAIINSAALVAAGISSTTPDPAGGKIDRDASGTPTGIIRESSALTLVRSKIPALSLEQRRKALNFAIADVLAHGVTSVQDNSDWEDFLALEELEHTHQLQLRVSEWLAFATPLPTLKERRASHPANDPLLHLGMLKGFMDGSLGSRTAALDAPYSDDPANSGIPRYTQDALNQLATERAAAGFQLGFHAIGDHANAMALNAFAAAEQVAPHADTPSTALRYRIEHAQVLLPADFARFQSEGVIASMQPSHLLTDMNWAPARLGSERVKFSYAWKSFLDHHVTVAFGTDYPVESIDPFRGLYSAITRQNEAGTMTYEPQEKITLNQAIYAYTQASAFAEFEEKTKGILAAGYLADFVVLDRDITKATPQELLHTQVLETIVNGEVVYARQSNTVANNTIHPNYTDDHADE
jgi:predicted amidohydrolase YtcJ